MILKKTQGLLSIFLKILKYVTGTLTACLLIILLKFLTHLEAYAITHNIDIIFLSETFLDFSYSNDDWKLQLSGYSLIRADHPRNLKRGGVCIVYKEHLPLICKSNLTFLEECLVYELNIGNKKCFIKVLYRSPSQWLNEFD